ncbi:tyrosine-type recombinase/integrase [Parageobacillus thermoglucosidasius]|uniref:Tyrosine-type recombinase/integrase n=1 Tax=Parageobacillus thermoglucosidasius TaxID=1426 RepID=A0AB38QXL3_PARTM|nr:tyrosine-type recombinase/integrase [Parageobacillus thermoglucosidasius]UOE75826.1 tyrosine-type recombinase/integrase [Parageobacillus thermoglucosidasius]
MLGAFLEWLHNEGKDEKTIKAYRSTINQFLKWYEETEGHTDLSQVKPVAIKEYISYMRNTLNRKQATINKSIASLKTFFAYLVDNEIIKDNPMTRIKIQKVQATETIGEKDVSKWLTKEEQEKFISYVELEKNEFKRLRNLAIIDLMLYAGLRVAEVEALRIDDVKVNGNVTITIREGKKGKYATVTLIEKYSKNLKKWLKYRQSLEKDIYKESPYLFVSERSGKMGARAIQVMLNKYAKLANMKNITPHRFRHSFCKNLANAGVPIETISKLARHESIETTKIYIDNSHAEMLEALKKM